MNKYYVYIYWRLDVNEPFYVGKGKNNRWKVLNERSDHFKKICNKSEIAVEIIKENLTESQAFYWEEKIIETLVFKYGYSIDIPNNRSNELGSHLVNSTWGGEGASGQNPFEKMNKETKKKWIDSHKGLQPFLGKHHSKETREKISMATKGTNNPFYGKTHTQKIKDKQMLDKGTKIIAINIKSKDMICFESIREAHRKGFDRSCISQCLNPLGNQSKHKGYKWYKIYVKKL